MTLRKGEDIHLKEEALDRTMWRAGFGRGFGRVVRQTAKWMNVVTKSKQTVSLKSTDLLLYAADCTRCTVTPQFIITVSTFQRPELPN
jgi:hypothetical protein